MADEEGYLEFVPSISVNVEAIKSESYSSGFNDGYAKGREDAFNEAYSELRSDIIGRLRAMMESGKDFNECLTEMEQ